MSDVEFGDLADVLAGDSGPGPEPADPGVEPLEVSNVAVYDIDGNGLNDLYMKALADGSLVVVHDENGDLMADTLGIDLNADGIYEVVVVKEAEGYSVYVDVDGDGLQDAEAVFTREQLIEANPDVVAALDMQFGVGSGAGNPIPEQAGAPAEDEGFDSPYVTDGQLVGDPQGDSEHWFQQAANGFCLPASVAQIVSEYTGIHFDDEQYFVEQANELRVFEVGPDGVPGVGIEGGLALLEGAGVPASIETGTGVETLVEYLEEGRRVIVAVDSGELWYDEQAEDNTMDHAIVVTGVDQQRGVVIVSDPGDPEGNAKEYPVDLFEDAWADSDYTAIVCDVTPEEFAGTESGSGAAPGTEVIADLGAGEVETPVAVNDSAAVDWAIQHSWAILPVLLGARLLAGGLNSKK